jgi:hypothetical protein
MALNGDLVAPAVIGQVNEEQDKLAAEISSLEIVADQQSEEPPHRSHDPQFNQKRSDPFQFGSRYLQEDDNVFEFNAWDHVETDDAYKEYAEQQFAMQRQSPASDFDKCKCQNLFAFFIFFHGRRSHTAHVMIYIHISIVHLNSFEDILYYNLSLPSDLPYSFYLHYFP